MIHTDENGQEYKICARSACGQRFRPRPNERADKFAGRQYCSTQCRVAANRQAKPQRQHAPIDRPSGFVNPDGAWRPAGFPVYPGGIEGGPDAA